MDIAEIVHNVLRPLARPCQLAAATCTRAVCAAAGSRHRFPQLRWTRAGKDAKAAAAKAAAAVKKNSWAKTRKPRYSVVFHRPKTLKRTRDPKYTRKRCGAARVGSQGYRRTAVERTKLGRRHMLQAWKVKSRGNHYGRKATTGQRPSPVVAAPTAAAAAAPRTRLGSRSGSEGGY
jgi:hypothetical protein